MNDILEDLLSQFKLTGHWWSTRSSDGEWFEVDEDLNDLLHQLTEALENF